MLKGVINHGAIASDDDAAAEEGEESEERALPLARSLARSASKERRSKGLEFRL